jgi:nucleotide-binding universal stress UspA family protein
VYQRILLAYDGSVEGRAALREGALLAKGCGAQVFLLSVVADTTGTRMAGGVDAGAIVQQEENYKAVLKDGVERLKLLGFDPVAKLVTGEPAREIGAFANQIEADLVVVGHRKQSMLGRWWSGPNGAYLVDHIRCSLLVGRNVITDEAFKAELLRSGGAAS